MQYTPQVLKEHLGDAYESDVEYVIDSHEGAIARSLNSAWEMVGKVPDSRLGDGGTMIVFKLVTKEETSEPEGGIE